MTTTMASAVQSRHFYPEEYLPESDGKPMAETDVHRKQMIDLLDALEEYYRDDPQIYVTGNIFLYYRDEDNLRQSISPDIFVVREVEKRERRIYLLDEEGKAPDVVIELTSANTKLEDLNTKRLVYASLGVREYFLFDPYGEALRPTLRGFLLENGQYIPMMGNRLISEVLGMELRLEEGRLRLYDRQTGERLRNHKESEAERRAEVAARKAAEAKAAQELAARQAAEAELARLREELTRRQEQKQ
jgi:Uma2 family endonuclease